MDIRLKSPEVQSSILHTIWMMMKEEVRGYLLVGHRQKIQNFCYNVRIFCHRILANLSQRAILHIDCCFPALSKHSQVLETGSMRPIVLVY